MMQRGAQAMRSRGGSGGSFASSPYAGGAQAAESGGLRLGSLGAAAVDLGTAKNPVHMMQVQRQTADAVASFDDLHCLVKTRIRGTLPSLWLHACLKRC